MDEMIFLAIFWNSKQYGFSIKKISGTQVVNFHFSNTFTNFWVFLILRIIALNIGIPLNKIDPFFLKMHLLKMFDSIIVKITISSSIKLCPSVVFVSELMNASDSVDENKSICPKFSVLFSFRIVLFSLLNSSSSPDSPLLSDYFFLGSFSW